MEEAAVSAEKGALVIRELCSLGGEGEEGRIINGSSLTLAFPGRFRLLAQGRAGHRTLNVLHPTSLTSNTIQ